MSTARYSHESCMTNLNDDAQVLASVFSHPSRSCSDNPPGATCAEPSAAMKANAGCSVMPKCRHTDQHRRHYGHDQHSEPMHGAPPLPCPGRCLLAARDVDAGKIRPVPCSNV
jgi:hypothetical protein